MMRIADIHCHLLPYVDDGAQDRDESIALLKMQYQQGVRIICFTPHLRKGMFETSDETIIRQYETLHEQAARVFKGKLKMCLSREYFCDSAFIQKLESGEVIPLGHGNYLLTEFSRRYTKSQFFEYVQMVLRLGYRPLIAHVERYPEMQDVNCIKRLIKMGAKIQVNAGSILGREGMKQALWARKLLKEGLVHIVASDGHDTEERPPELGKAAKYLEKKLGEEKANKLLWENQMKILNSRRRKENGVN